MTPLENKVPTLASYTTVTLIIPQIYGTTTRAVMDELSQVLHRDDSKVPDVLFSSIAALNRELLTSISLECGVALPQVEVQGLQRPRFALGHAKPSLPWRANIFPPVEFVFLVVEPAKSTPESKQLLAALKRLGSDRLCLDKLRRAQTSEEILAVLSEVPITPATEPARLTTR